jgi:hypothetical protein
MKLGRSRKPDEPQPVSVEGASWSFGPVDAAIAAGSLTLALAVCAPVAFHFRSEARQLDRARMNSLQRTRMHRVTLERNQSRREALTQFRREVNRYVAEVEARPMVAWTTVVGELSRRRPNGLWTTRLSGNGPHFRAYVAAERPDLVSLYTQSLRQSPYVDFAALPAGAAPSTQAQVVGRLRGE